MGIKIVSFNIGMGAERDADNSTYLLDIEQSVPEIISFIKNTLLESVDEKAVICLQEVNFNTTPPDNRNFLFLLKRELGPAWDYFYYDPTHVSNQQYGIGIITNLPGTLPEGRRKEQKWRIWTEEGECRGAIAIKLTFEGHFFWVVNTHLGFVNQPSQVDKLLDRIFSFDHVCPVMLCGDFNITDLEYPYGDRGKNHAVYQQTMRKLERNGFFKSKITSGSAHTFHSWNSNLRGRIVDYIMTSYPFPASTIESLKCYEKVDCVIPEYYKNSEKYYASDHSALIMTYTFPDLLSE